MSEIVERESGEDLALPGGRGMLPGAREFFDELGISMETGQTAQYILGDNIAGYFEGYTMNYRRNEGYKMKDTVLFRNYATFFNEQLNNRMVSALTETILPHGTLAAYPGGLTEELIMLSGDYALAVRIRAPEPGILAAVPLLMADPLDYSWERHGDSVVLAPLGGYFESEYPPYMAVTADRSFEFLLLDETRYSEARDVLMLQPRHLPGIVSSLEPQEEMTVYYAFGFTLEEALEKAARLSAGDGATQAEIRSYEGLTRSWLRTNDPDYDRAVTWAKASAYSMVVEEFGKGIWAGLPWFKDNWGRDTFIALPGTLLVAGRFDEAREVLDNFAGLQNLGTARIAVTAYPEELSSALQTRGQEVLGSRLSGRVAWEPGNLTFNLDRSIVLDPSLGESAEAELREALEELAPGISVEFQLVRDRDYGRIPNRVTSLDNIIYNTTDGTPWMIREIYEYLMYSGDLEYSRSIYPVVRTALDGAQENYVDEDGLLTHEAADTWMDAKIAGRLPWSDRGTRAVDIQALWITSLRIGAHLAQQNGESPAATRWSELARRAQDSFRRIFWNEEAGRMADRIREDDTVDDKIRPNQYMVISVPLEDRIVEDRVEARLIADSFSRLVYPYGVSSLNQDHEYFHPLHENLRYHHKDAAYHNGTIWGWNAGFVVTALSRHAYQDRAYELSQNLADQILNHGTRGSMSENMDALLNENGEFRLTGTYSQAWSVSEFARNAYQDYLGFRPNLLENLLILAPALPSAWSEFQARLPYGQEEFLEITMERQDTGLVYRLSLAGASRSRELQMDLQAQDGSWSQARFVLPPEGPRELVWNPVTERLTLDGRSQAVSPLRDSYRDILGELPFQVPRPYVPEDFPMLQDRNILQGIIENGEFR